MTWNIVITGSADRRPGAGRRRLYLFGPEVVCDDGDILRRWLLGAWITPRAALTTDSMPGMKELLAGAVYVYKSKIISAR
jgi:hypothetical protein